MNETWEVVHEDSGVRSIFAPRVDGMAYLAILYPGEEKEKIVLWLQGSIDSAGRDDLLLRPLVKHRFDDASIRENRWLSFSPAPSSEMYLQLHCERFIEEAKSAQTLWLAIYGAEGEQVRDLSFRLVGFTQAYETAASEI